ncbi:MAG TPA: hypothetical protein VL132_00715 [Planctomycetaceae bacterium]|nr:hypothetical protein [Planctomycetaceae bacterium]
MRLPAFAALAVVTLSLATAVACPFCSAPSLTLTEQLTQADAALLVSWAGGEKGKSVDGGSTIYKVVEVAHQPADGKWKAGDAISLVRYRAGKEGEQFLLLGTKSGKEIDWGSPLEVSETSYKYMKHAPKPDAKAADRLRYFLTYLENADPIISADAYGEFANANYEDITQLSKEMPRDKVRKWLTSAETSPGRMGLYGLLLGLAGNADDAELMQQKITESGEDFRLGIDGIMGGYLLLTGEKGLEVLEQTKLADKKAPFSETYAAMQALRFMWQYGDNRIPPERLKQSMRILLERPELTDLVIADLARWKDWSISDRLMGMYGQQEYDIPSIKRAIVRFYLACENEAKKHPEAVPADLAKVASQNLAELEKKDPKTVSEAKRFFILK